mgnify:CR=1 FL=1
MPGMVMFASPTSANGALASARHVTDKDASLSALCYNKDMYLAAGIAALLIGPAAYQFLQGLSRFRHALDLAVTGVITVLALLILWDTAESGGWLIVAFAAAGLASKNQRIQNRIR